jgi:excisionase family DNA binding protein
VEKRYLTLKETSEYLSIPQWTLYALVNQKRIPVIRKARRLKFDVKRLDEWMAESAEEPVET